MSSFAIIETGGKQYRVSAGDKVQIEKLPQLTGDGVVFDKVLLIANGDSVAVGGPYVSGAQVHGTLTRQGREDKKIVFRYHSKTRYRKKKGHRQYFSEVKIEKI